MNKQVKIVAGVLLAGLVAIQLIHPARNTQAGVSPNDIGTVVTVPVNVAAVLKTSCYDCHSNNTVYPWYSYIQPIDWWLTDHINDGKHHLNFSEFATYSNIRKAKKLKEVAGEIEEGGMPLPNYTLIHHNAILTEDQKKLVMDWANTESALVYAKVTPEELAEDKRQREARKKERK